MLILFVLNNKRRFNCYVLNRSTRNASLPLLNVPNFYSSKYRLFASYQAPLAYNNLVKASPNFTKAVTESVSIPTIKKILKAYFFQFIKCST